MSIKDVFLKFTIVFSLVLFLGYTILNLNNVLINAFGLAIGYSFISCGLNYLKRD